MRWPRLSKSQSQILSTLFKASLSSPYQGLGATAAAAAATAAGERPSFRFAAAHSANPHLAAAIVECVQQLKSSLGPGIHPDLCQLLVTSRPHANSLSLAPSFLQECFTSREQGPPVVIGGAVREFACSWTSSAGPAPSTGVSILGAHLPGIQLLPFHSKEAALPDLGPAASWPQLMQAEEGGDVGKAAQRTGLLTFFEPHSWHQAMGLQQLVHNLLPKATILGSSLPSDAWGTPTFVRRSLRGAVFLGSKTYDEGVAGCLLHGPLQMSILGTQGSNRPLTQPMTVTAAESHAITELNGRAAMDEIIPQLLHEGCRDVSALKDWFATNPQLRGSFLLAVHGGSQAPMLCKAGLLLDSWELVCPQQVSEGSIVQLMLPFDRGAEERVRLMLQALRPSLEATLQQPASAAAFLSCGAERAPVEPAALEAELPGLPFQTQDSAESLGLLLKELYDYTKAKSIIDADTVFPLLLVADKYNVKTVLLWCTQWLDGIDSGRLSYTLLRVSPAKGADIVANALAWLTILMRLADPKPLHPFKQMCVKEAAAGMDWESSRWAQLPLGVVLAVCRGLSARHRRELKKRMELHAKSPLEQPYRCVEEVQNALRAILSMV